MIALNAIVAKQLILFKKDVDNRISNGDKKDEAILKELQKLIKESKKIRFEGNGYSEEWVKEAKTRGLSNLKDTPSALKVMIDKNTISLFEKLGIFNKIEMCARYEVELENYIMKLQIEARILKDLCHTHIIPSAVSYQNELITNVVGIKDLFSSKSGNELTKTQTELIKSVSTHINNIHNNCEKMLNNRKKANTIENNSKKAEAYCNNVKKYFDVIRYDTDKLEQIISDEYWPLPKLRELLFTR
jgi:glutamine synthetase